MTHQTWTKTPEHAKLSEIRPTTIIWYPNDFVIQSPCVSILNVYRIFFELSSFILIILDWSDESTEELSAKRLLRQTTTSRVLLARCNVMCLQWFKYRLFTCLMAHARNNQQHWRDKYVGLLLSSRRTRLHTMLQDAHIPERLRIVIWDFDISRFTSLNITYQNFEVGTCV